MSEMRTRRSVSSTRSARRSLVELTAAASRVVDDSLFVLSGSGIAVSPDDPARSNTAKTSDHAIVARQATAPSPAVVPESRNAAGPRNDERVDSDSTAGMMVKIAKDYQNEAFENIKVSLNAALDHAKDYVETRVRSEAASKDNDGSSLEGNFLTVFKEAATEFRAEAVELMKANVITTLEYTRELAGTRTLAEFVELSSAQARKQCELMLKQAGALKSLAQTITKSGSD
jgi:Phasin protein